MPHRILLLTLFTYLFAVSNAAFRQAVAGQSGADDLLIADRGKTNAAVLVSPEAGEWEKRAAEDLVKYVQLMSGAKLAIAADEAVIAAALSAKGPVLIVGQLALKLQPSLNQALQKAAKKNPVLRADAVALRREGNRVYLAGLNDDCHYYAVAELLRRWGCRWYLPTDIGQCIPEQPTLKVGALDFAYGSPFEVRRYWISWVGDTTGKPEFMRRNMFNDVSVPNGHILSKYTGDIVPEGKTHWNVPITDPKTAAHVAEQVAPIYAEGKHVQLGIEDGLYESDSPLDKELTSLQYDKYFMRQSVTDAFMVFYNGVAERLIERHPNSPAKIGFLAYANLTIPPVRDITAKPPLVAYLAPIDIDPIHHMDDPRSQPRREYKQMLYGWAKVMQGRVVIYDYDQGMLVWRDIPAPSLQMIRHDVKHYQQAGILGVDTESRGAIGTTFTNLHFRGQLMWNPEADVDALLAEFYPKFYGPAAEPMRTYWSAINDAWENTIATEHEYFLIPAVYTPQLVATLKTNLAAAEQALRPLAAKPSRSRNEQLYLDRLRFTQLSFGILESYTSMIRAAWTNADYRAAVAHGERGLATRETMTDTNGTFTTYRNYPEHGAAWWPGEVDQYRKLAELTDGPRGQLIAKTPLEWSFRRDPDDVGVKQGWATQPIDMTYWNSRTDQGSVASHQENPGHWEMLRTDLYVQAQGIIDEDYASYTGHAWYRTDLELTAEQLQGNVHLMFPGLFNVCWLYVNGQQVAEREKYNPIWWYNDYKFEWDVDLTGKLKAGKNTIALRLDNPHHFGGMFRRPFLYRTLSD
jgi:hypothetical protein